MVCKIKELIIYTLYKQLHKIIYTLYKQLHKTEL